MKRILKTFNIEEWGKGGYKVITRDGRNARIICSDCKSDINMTLISLIDNGKN